MCCTSCPSCREEEVEVEQDRLEVVGFTAEQRERRGDQMLRQ